MPYVYRDFVRGSPRDALTIPASAREVLREQFAQTFEENPIMAVRRWLELREDERTGPLLPAEVARQKLKDAGLEHDLKVSEAGITQAALDTLMFRKRIEKRRQEIFSRAEGGFGETAARLGVAFATTLADPIGAGLNFVPVVGQVRYARWLAAAGSARGRVAVRAGVGAAEGVAGAALYEPFLYAMRTQEQADYDAVDSLLNVTFGGVVGSGLHVTVGSVSDLFAEAAVNRIPRAENLSAVDRVIERRLAVRIARDLKSAIAEYSELEGAMGGRLLNTDLARELSPEYRADRTRSAAVHEPASYLVKRMYERRLAEPVQPGEEPLVVFSGGGTGAGKTTGLNEAINVDPRVARAQIIYDTNLSGLESSIDKIEKALEAGRRVMIVYTHRDPVDALVNGALPRAMRTGRTVPLAEHAKTHVGAARTIKELAERYAGDDRVQIAVVNNSLGKGNQQLGNLADIPDYDYNSVRGSLEAAVETEYAAGRISEAVYRGTTGRAPHDQRPGSGRGQGAEDGDRPAVTAAERVATSPPEVQQAALRAAVGQAVEGRPIDVEPILTAAEGGPVARSVETPDAEAMAASRHADETLRRAVDDTPDAILKAAEEEADMAMAEARELLQRLGRAEPQGRGMDAEEAVAAEQASVLASDPEMAAVMEGARMAERWARAAELATVCLVRGG